MASGLPLAVRCNFLARYFFAWILKRTLMSKWRQRTRNQQWDLSLNARAPFSPRLSSSLATPAPSAASGSWRELVVRRCRAEVAAAAAAAAYRHHHRAICTDHFLGTSRLHKYHITYIRRHSMRPAITKQVVMCNCTWFSMPVIAEFLDHHDDMVGDW